MAPELRRAEIVAAAARLCDQQGWLPLSMEAIAREIGVSKALIYSYFPTQYDLLNAVLIRCFQELDELGLGEALQGPDLDAVSVAAALIYFDHVTRSGPLLHMLMADLFMVGHLEREVIRRRDAIYHRIGGLARRELKLAPKANLLAVNLIMTIPEEAGRRVLRGDMVRDVGRLLTAQLVASAVRGLRL